MPQKLIDLLREHGTLAKLMAAEVRLALEDPDLTLASVAELNKRIEEGQQRIRALVDTMKASDAPQAAFQVAQAISELWEQLIATTAYNARTLQTLELLKPEEQQGDVGPSPTSTELEEKVA
ncbi:MAG TPA: hypothetical protein VGN97_10935 [Mesorhizobium sp.]|jgi:signal transduction histidine kinase|nr:hypothetical protein [Mesorhizobium sp.]